MATTCIMLLHSTNDSDLCKLLEPHTVRTWGSGAALRARASW